LSPARARRANGAATTGRASPRRLVAEAEIARRNSYSPYSKFPVGAALLTKSGRIVHGCNVENASYGLSMCAERTAVWKAVSEGDQKFVAIAIVAGPESAAAPCGACRQVLYEFAPGLSVYWRDAGGRIVGRKIEELLRDPFGPADLAASRRRRARPVKRAARTRSRA
jgi:cytidine deaminase